MTPELPVDRAPPLAVLFDMDGVIFDSETLYRAKYYELLDDAGHEASNAGFLELVGRGWTETVGVLEAEFPGIDGADFVARWKHACHPNRGVLPELKPGVCALLDLLESRGIVAAIATGSQREVAHGYLDHHELRHRFAAIVAHEDVTRGKPHPEPFLKAAEAVHRSPEQCLVLEDSANGLRAAVAAGTPAIFVPDLIAPCEEIELLALAIGTDLFDVHQWMSRLPHSASG